MNKHSFTWSKIFPEDILDEGWDYFNKGKAKNLSRMEYGYQVRVRGRRNYNVDIYINDYEELSFMDCTCDDGQEGYYCKHMVAALYLLEAEGVPIYELDPDYYESEEQELSSVSGTLQKTDGSDTGSPQKKSMASWLKDMERLQKEGTRLYLSESESPVENQSMEEYRYFHYEEFRRGLEVSKQTWTEAQKLLDEKDLVEINVNMGFLNDLNEPYMVGEISGRDYFGYQYARLRFDRHSITYGRCDIWNCGFRKSSKSHLGHKLCKHEAALILYLEKYLQENNIGDTSNLSGMRLIQFMSPSGQNTSDAGDKAENAPMLDLVPVLHWDEDGSLSLTFKVGAKRLYVIKKLPEFMENVNENRIMQFGKNTRYQLGRSYIMPEQLPVLDYIEHAMEEDAQLRTTLRYTDALPPLAGEISLYGNNLDEFFNLIGEGKFVEYVKKPKWGKNEKGTLKCSIQDYRPDLEISGDLDESTNAFQGIKLTGEIPQFFYGQRFAYTIGDGQLVRIPMDTAKGLKPLVRAQRFGPVDIRIGRNHLNEFYRDILPRLRDAADITENDVEIIRNYLPLDPVFLCYLDVNDDQMVCRVDVAYGHHVHSIIEDYIHRAVIMNYRDERKEGDIMVFLSDYFPHMDYDNMVLFSERDEESVYLFLSDGLPRLLQMAEVHMTDRFKRLGIRKNIKYNLGVSIESNILDLDIISEGYSREELMDILKAYRRRASYIRLKDGDFLKIDDNESIGILSELMDSLHLTPKEFVRGKMHIPAYRALYLEKMLERSQFIEADRNKAFRRLIREFDTATNADYDLPESLDMILRNYQKDGYQWLRTMDQLGFGGILADEMGLGKTLQVIAVLLAHQQERHGQTGQLSSTSRNEHIGHEETGRRVADQPATSLIVCPASLVYNWREELQRFAPRLSVGIVAGSKGERTNAIAAFLDYDVLVTSYDLLKRDIDLYENKSFRFMILDEAQYIKNQQTAAAKSVKLISAQTRFALTGTPIENRLSDMWSIFDYLMPGFLHDYTVFRKEYEQPIVKNGQKEISERLSRMVSPFILRRKKMDVLKDLPEKLEEIRYAGMERTQRKLYDAHVIRLRKSLGKQNDEEFKKNRIEVLAELTKLRQICCDPSLYYEDYSGGSAKREACMSLVESIVEGEHKALIFSQFTTMLELLERDLSTAGIPYYKITGATPKEKRIALVNAFNHDDTPIFLISLKAGGTGLNLTGADVVIHYDPWWNLAVQNQATDRAHRIGQTQIVTVYKLIIKGTIEEKIVKMQESKKQLAEDILGSENIGNTTISREELLALLE